MSPVLGPVAVCFRYSITTARLAHPSFGPPCHCSAVVAGHVIVGAEGIELFVGSLVSVARITGRWRILTMGDTMTVISQDRSPPYIRNIVLDDVMEQFTQRLRVYAPRTLISPWIWPKPPVEPNMLVERPVFPTRASRVLVREMASAIGAADYSELSGDADVQRIAEHDRHIHG